MTDTPDELVEWEAFVALPRIDGQRGTHPAWSRFVAARNDTRCAGGTARIVGPATATVTVPSPDVAEHLDALEVAGVTFTEGP